MANVRAYIADQAYSDKKDESKKSHGKFMGASRKVKLIPWSPIGSIN
jgi:hypothetical protein